MIQFDHLTLSEEILQALSKLHIDYVFQPIFEADGKTVYAREALMRPREMSVTDLIDMYTKKEKLHIVEVATFFGAMQAYVDRGYEEKVAINSFPSECITDEESRVFYEHFGENIRGRMIVEVLEYPKFSYDKWTTKNSSVKAMENKVSLDDFGSGINDLSKVQQLKPDIVKLDRSLLSGIDRDEFKQKRVREQIDIIHDMGIKIVAEGVETKEEFEYLKAFGADYFQGFYLARPE